MADIYTQNTLRFFALLARIPYLLPLFDLTKAEYNPEAVERFLGSASHGEQTMARFALSVWVGDNTFQFDLMDAVRVLDTDQRQIIQDWLDQPFLAVIKYPCSKR